MTVKDYGSWSFEVCAEHEWCHVRKFTPGKDAPNIVGEVPVAHTSDPLYKYGLVPITVEVGDAKR